MRSYWLAKKAIAKKQSSLQHLQTQKNLSTAQLRGTQAVAAVTHDAAAIAAHYMLTPKTTRQYVANAVSRDTVNAQASLQAAFAAEAAKLDEADGEQKEEVKLSQMITQTVANVLGNNAIPMGQQPYTSLGFPNSTQISTQPPDRSVRARYYCPSYRALEATSHVVAQNSRGHHGSLSCCSKQLP